MRILSFLLFFSCCTLFQFSSAQTPQEQLQQETRDLIKQIADEEQLIAEAKTNKEDPDTIKSMEDDLVRLKQQLALLQKAANAIAGLPASLMNAAANQANSDNGNIRGSIPARKSALLNALPKDNLNKDQLQLFLNTLYADVKRKTSPPIVADTQKIINQLENDPKKIAASAVAAWYNNAPAQAALLVTYAAVNSPDANTLNNCGAIMNLSGREEKAIPILKYVLTSFCRETHEDMHFFWDSGLA
jgi:type II secretory pathway component PulM